MAKTETDKKIEALEKKLTKQSEDFNKAMAESEAKFQETLKQAEEAREAHLKKVNDEHDAQLDKVRADAKQEGYQAGILDLTVTEAEREEAAGKEYLSELVHDSTYVFTSNFDFTAKVDVQGKKIPLPFNMFQLVLAPHHAKLLKIPLKTLAGALMAHPGYGHDFIQTGGPGFTPSALAMRFAKKAAKKRGIVGSKMVQGVRTTANA